MGRRVDENVPASAEGSIASASQGERRQRPRFRIRKIRSTRSNRGLVGWRRSAGRKITKDGQAIRGSGHTRTTSRGWRETAFVSESHFRCECRFDCRWHAGALGVLAAFARCRIDWTTDAHPVHRRARCADCVGRHSDSLFCRFRIATNSADGRGGRLCLTDGGGVRGRSRTRHDRRGAGRQCTVLEHRSSIAANETRDRPVGGRIGRHDRYQKSRRVHR